MLNSGKGFLTVQTVAFGLLKNGLNEEYPYHGLRHTQEVMRTVRYYAGRLRLNRQQTMMLMTAALFHDIGYIASHEDHETRGVWICREHLIQLRYTPGAIDFICEMILATSQPRQPTNRLQKLLCDADLDYLGRDDYFDISLDWRLERELQGYGISDAEWLEDQRRFLGTHRYFTDVARDLRQPGLERNLERLERITHGDWGSG